MACHPETSEVNEKKSEVDEKNVGAAQRNLTSKFSGRRIPIDLGK
jgi:hypothetical protein